ncbi:hypothetical protein C2845_PM05G15970 [Panicum miliaceum]|uniref:Uncharacterized protein n=1 Tax=Panicum miliaceum TaxID=4540 RepID=A0A3L6SX92_PANMI|nr:hypothetical protein C2845_PM05G15970 [Panicum miliaceum]
MTTVTVPCQRLFGDELRNPSTDRCNPIPETRNLCKPFSVANSIIHSQRKSQNHTEFQSRARVATINSKNLDTRLRILRLRLGFFKIKLARFLDDVYKNPPDPGPANSSSILYLFDSEEVREVGERSTSHLPPEDGPEISSSTHYITDLKEDDDEREGFTTQLLPKKGPTIPSSTQLTVGIEEVQEERKEFVPQVLPEEKKLQVIRDCNLWHVEASYKVDGGSFERDKVSLQIPLETPLQGNYQPTLPSRCLLNCPIEEKKAYPEEPKVGVKESNHLEGDVGTLPRRVGKEVAESSYATTKRAFVVDMSMGRRTPCNQLLAVASFLSILVMTSRILVDRTEEVWNIRDLKEDCPKEAKLGRNFILESSKEDGWKHVIFGGLWQYKRNAFWLEGLVAGADPSSVFTHVSMRVQFKIIPFYRLTKEQAHKPSTRKTMNIYSNTRGCTNDKIIRMRVQVPFLWPCTWRSYYITKSHGKQSEMETNVNDHGESVNLMAPESAPKQTKNTEAVFIGISSWDNWIEPWRRNNSSAEGFEKSVVLPDIINQNAGYLTSLLRWPTAPTGQCGGEELEGLCVEELYQIGREVEAGLHRVPTTKPFPKRSGIAEDDWSLDGNGTI